MQDIFVSFINTLVYTIEERDDYTAGHMKRVADYAYMVAKEMRLTEEQKVDLYMASLVHDIGKIKIPLEILVKTKNLSKIEFEFIKCHPQVGANILKQIKYFKDIPEIVLQHHERIDGSGYPNGLKGDKIRIEAQILGIVDVYEAMISDRPYRKSLGMKITRDELINNNGIKYNTDIINVCEKILL